MDNIVIGNNTITFKDPNQIINMGGPWVGNLILNESLLIDNVILDNYILTPNNARFYFIRYHQVSKWQNQNFFLITFIDFENKSVYQFDIKFDKIFIQEIENDTCLEYYDAFHNQDERRKKSLDLKKYSKNEIFKIR